MSNAKNEVKVSENLLTNLLWSVIVSFGIILIPHFFKKTVPSPYSNPYSYGYSNANEKYWAGCPFSESTYHEASSELGAQFLSVFDHLGLWAITMICVFILISFFAKNKFVLTK